MCVIDCHDMNLAVKVSLNLNTSNQKFNSLPNDKVLDWSKLRAIFKKKKKQNKCNEKLKFVLGRVENIVGKGKNVFLVFP